MATKKKEEKKAERAVTITVSIDNEPKNFTLDTGAMKFAQNETIEKLLASIGYQELMAGFFSDGAGADIVQRAALEQKSTDKSADIKSGLKVTEILAKLHQKLVSAGIRGDLIAHLLTPEGERWTSETPKLIREKVLPELDVTDAEKVLGCFFTFDKLLRSGFPTYLIGSH